jgi:hypothetical protein
MHVFTTFSPSGLISLQHKFTVFPLIVCFSIPVIFDFSIGMTVPSGHQSLAEVDYRRGVMNAERP